jgi:hypothetical protein
MVRMERPACRWILIGEGEAEVKGKRFGVEY